MTDGIDLVVVGLGYVGLPLAHEAVKSGLSVAGLDVMESRINALNAGRTVIDDLSDADIADIVAGGFRATSDASVIARADSVVLCVPTPLSEDGGPDLGAVITATKTIAAHLQPGTLVALESTTYPGTTAEVVLPILEGSGLLVGDEFHLAYSPERIDPGNAVYGLRNTPKVVGGHTEACGDVALTFYGKLVDTVVRAKGTREAEMAKLLENTYRHINIALVNEMAVFCDELDIDLWDAIRLAATKPFGFEAFYPGPGVGGHCIPIDPNYLSYKVRTLGYPFRFVDLAQEVNARMPAYVAARVQRLLNTHRKPVNGSKILMLGVTYKADIADERESPARPLARRLLELGAELSYHDSHVPEWSVKGTPVRRIEDAMAAAAEADLVLVVQAHADYDFDAILEVAPLVFDTRGKLTGPSVERL